MTSTLLTEHTPMRHRHATSAAHGPSRALPAAARATTDGPQASSLRFSIITCTRNSAATVAQTIESVRRQTWAHVEHIFVDGSSTDDTLAIVRRLAPEAIVLENVTGGISRAMNVGVHAASGDVIAHLHSDDLYHDAHTLERAAQALQRSGREWVTGRVKLLYDDGRLVDERPPGALPAFTYWRYAAQFVHVMHPATFIRRRAFLEVGDFDTSLRYAMDIDYWLRLGRRYPAEMLDETLTVFRMHDGSTSFQDPSASRREEFLVRWRHARYAPSAFAIFSARSARRALLRRLGRIE